MSVFGNCFLVALGRHNFGLGYGGGSGSWWLSLSGKFGESAVNHIIVVYEPEIEIPDIHVLKIDP